MPYSCTLLPTHGLKCLQLESLCLQLLLQSVLPGQLSRQTGLHAVDCSNEREGGRREVKQYKVNLVEVHMLNTNGN